MVGLKMLATSSRGLGLLPPTREKPAVNTRDLPGEWGVAMSSFWMRTSPPCTRQDSNTHSMCMCWTFITRLWMNHPKQEQWCNRHGHCWSPAGLCRLECA
jgi:hypothetical protein